MGKRDVYRAGSYLAARRGELEMTQGELAIKAGIDAKTIGSFEQGQHWPWSRTRTRIERALGMPILTLERISMGEDPPGTPVPARLRRAVADTAQDAAEGNGEP